MSIDKGFVQVLKQKQKLSNSSTIFLYPADRRTDKLKTNHFQPWQS